MGQRDEIAAISLVVQQSARESASIVKSSLYSKKKTTDNTGGSRPADVMTYLKESKSNNFDDQFAFNTNDTEKSLSIIYVQF